MARYGEAEPLYKRCLQLREEVLVPKHPDTLSILLNYSACLVMLKQDNQALLHLKKTGTFIETLRWRYA